MLDAQVPLDDGGVSSGKLGLLAEVALALLGLLGKDVALESLGAHDLAGTGDAEALCGALVGLHLRHCRPSLLASYQFLSSSPFQAKGRSAYACCGLPFLAAAQ